MFISCTQLYLKNSYSTVFFSNKKSVRLPRICHIYSLKTMRASFLEIFKILVIKIPKISFIFSQFLYLWHNLFVYLAAFEVFCRFGNETKIFTWFLFTKYNVLVARSRSFNKIFQNFASKLMAFLTSPLHNP